MERNVGQGDRGGELVEGMSARGVEQAQSLRCERKYRDGIASLLGRELVIKYASLCFVGYHLN